MKLSGTVEKVDMGAGVFVLKASDGKTYQLRGLDRSLKQAGKRVEIEGDIDGNAVSAGMTGPVLNVTGSKAL
jgi:hypothetical protein